MNAKTQFYNLAGTRMLPQVRQVVEGLAAGESVAELEGGERWKLI